MISTETTKLIKPSCSLLNNSNKDSENKSSKGKHDKGGKGAKSQKDTSKPGGNDGGKVECGYCGGAHWQANCFKDPNGPNYRPGKPAKGTSNTKFNSQNRNGNPKRRGGGPSKNGLNRRIKRRSVISSTSMTTCPFRKPEVLQKKRDRDKTISSNLKTKRMKLIILNLFCLTL